MNEDGQKEDDRGGPVSDDRIRVLTNNAFERSIGRPDQELSQRRAAAWEYYMRQQFATDDPGETDDSMYISSDVQEVVDGTLAQLMRVFANAENLISFDAVGPNDEQQAQQETDAVQHAYWKDNDGFMNTFFWLFDALVGENGFIQAYWVEDELHGVEEYSKKNDQELAQLFADPGLVPLDQEEIEPEEEGGEPLFNVRFKRVREPYVKVESFPPDQFRITPDADTLGASAMMCGREREATRSYLIEMGFSKDQVNDLDPWEDESHEKQAKKQTYAEDQTIDKDKSQDTIQLRVGYIKIDRDGDGISELLEVWLANEKLLYWEEDNEPAIKEVDRNPYHVLNGGPLPHKFVGRGPATKSMDLQEMNSGLVRGMMNNLNQAANPMPWVNEFAVTENTYRDYMLPRVAKMVRVGGDPNTAVSMQTVPFTAGQSFPMLEYLQMVKRDRTGINSDAEGLSPESLKNIQTTVMAQANDQSTIKLEMMASIFASTGFRTLMLHIRELMQKNSSTVRMMKLNNNWRPVNPSSWKYRYNTTLGIGLAVGTTQSKLLALESIWQKQAEMAQAGGLNLTVMPKQIYNTAAEMARLSKYPNPNLFFTDPGNATAPPQADEAQQLQQQQLQLQQRQQALDEQRAQVDAAKLELKAQEQQLKHQQEMHRLQMQHDKQLDDVWMKNEELAARLRDQGHQVSEDYFKRRITERETVVKERTAAAQETQANASAAATLSNAGGDGVDPEDVLIDREHKQAQTAKLRKETEKLDSDMQNQSTEPAGDDT